jgi:hypothetical protein
MVLSAHACLCNFTMLFAMLNRFAELTSNLEASLALEHLNPTRSADNSAHQQHPSFVNNTHISKARNYHKETLKMEMYTSIATSPAPPHPHVSVFLRTG